jgi:hypothetical protein
MVIADDLLPPQDWDLLLDQLIEPLDPERISFVLKVRDSPAEQDALVRHPVVSRAYYRRHGLFSPEYRGVYCDSDISTRAFWHSTILDGRSLVLEHHHHTTDAYVPRSASQAMVNATEEYRHGLQTYNSSWTLRERSAPLLLVHIAYDWTAESLSSQQNLSTAARCKGREAQEPPASPERAVARVAHGIKYSGIKYSDGIRSN